MVIEGPFVWKLTNEGTEFGKLDLNIRSMVLNETGDIYGIQHRFIDETPRAFVTRFTSEGQFVSRWSLGTQVSTVFDDVAVDAFGNVIVVNRPNSTIYKFSPEGEMIAEHRDRNRMREARHHVQPAKQEPGK